MSGRALYCLYALVFDSRTLNRPCGYAAAGSGSGRCIMDDCRGRVLVVDDNELIRRLAASLLKKKNFTVETAASGRYALEQVSVFIPDVIVLDVMMEGMDGFECCRRLKAEDTTRDIPVVMISSNAESIDKIKGLEIGAADYVAKPFDYGELLARVETQVKMKRLLDELAAKNARLEEMVRKDSLTNLYNHRCFHERIHAEFDESMRSSKPLCCIVCDIDHFKKINDTSGHQAGDMLLQSLSSIFLSMMRRCDTASRYGGDEFAFILPETDAHTGAAFAEQIRQRIASTVFCASGRDISITVSMGLASAPSCPVSTCTALIRYADEALYRAKQTGRNKVVVFEDGG